MKLVLNEVQSDVLKNSFKLYLEVWNCNLKAVNNHPAFTSRKYDQEFVNKKWTELEVVLEVKGCEMNREAVNDRQQYLNARKEVLAQLTNMEFTNELEVDEKILSLIKEATNLYGRIGMGQLSDIGWHPIFLERKVFSFDVETEIYQIRQSVFDDLYARGHSYGIRNEATVEESKIAFDIHQVARNKLAYMRNPEGDKWNVNFDSPRQYSQQPLATII